MAAKIPDLTPQSRQLEEALLTVDRVGLVALFAECTKSYSPLQVFEQVIGPALTRIGDAWERGEVALSEVYMASRLCEELVDSVAWPANSVRGDLPPIGLAVFEDYHMLGKRIVYAFLRAAGLEVADYGRAVADEVFEKVRGDGVQILLLSTLMLRSALRVRDLRSRFDAEGLDVKIIVGGAPYRFDPQLWQEVGADAMGRNGPDAIACVEAVVQRL